MRGWSLYGGNDASFPVFWYCSLDLVTRLLDIQGYFSKSSLNWGEKFRQNFILSMDGPACLPLFCSRVVWQLLRLLISTKLMKRSSVLFMYRDFSIFPPESNFIQVWLKQGHASLYKIMLALVLYCSSLLLRCSSISFPSILNVLAQSEPSAGGGVRCTKGVQGRQCCGLAPFPLPLWREVVCTVIRCFSV